LDYTIPFTIFLVGLKAVDPFFIPSDDPWQKVFTISLIAGEQI